jgi:hypothetical protein
MSKAKASNAEPMEFETFVMPNLNNERARLSREAEGLNKTELVERAKGLGIPTDGSKDDIEARVRNAARND